MPKQFSVADLKKLLKANDPGWQVDPALSDNHQIPEHPLGAEPPRNLRLAEDLPKVDLKKLITEETNNPYLLERRKALGFIQELKTKKRTTTLSTTEEHAAELHLTLR